MEVVWSSIIEIIEVVMKCVITAGIPYLFVLAEKKINNDRAKAMMHDAQNLITDTVVMVNQTFVQSLKKEGKFDAEAQRIAFEKAKDNIIAVMSKDMKAAVINQVGDLEAWLTTQIEASVAGGMF